MAEELTTLDINQLRNDCMDIMDLAEGLKEIIIELAEESGFNDKKTAVITVILNEIIALAEEHV